MRTRFSRRRSQFRWSLASSARGEDRPTPILKKEVELRFLRHELTVFRFALTGKGALVHGSVNDVKHSLIMEYARAHNRLLRERPGG